MALERSDVNLPGAATQAVELFRSELQDSLGDRLHCLALYGSAVQGGWRPRRSDLNLLVITAELGPAELALVGRAAARAGEKLAPVVLAEPELPELALLAPATLWDVIEQHRLLAGDDRCLAPVPQLDDLARQLRFELRDKLHRLRAAYVQQAGRPAVLEATARHSFGSILHLLRGALRLYGRDAALHPVQALGEVARTMQLNLDLLRHLFTLRYEDERLARGRIDGLFGDYLALVETAGDRLAELPPFSATEAEPAPEEAVPTAALEEPDGTVALPDGEREPGEAAQTAGEAAPEDATAPAMESATAEEEPAKEQSEGVEEDQPVPDGPQAESSAAPAASPMVESVPDGKPS